jgi:peptidoglycan-associated lipoprotein
MRKLIWCFAVVLVGCSGHRRHYPDFYSAPVPRVANQAEPDAGPIPASATEVAGKLPEVGKLAPAKRPTTVDDAIRDANGALEDAYFAYDRSDLSAEALGALQRDAELLCAILAEFPGLKVTLEGHCDERGSAEYNLALGDRRARRAEEVLREYGVPAGAVEIVSYGKEAPQCVEANESCRQKNRRAHMSVRRQ